MKMHITEWQAGFCVSVWSNMEILWKVAVGPSVNNFKCPLMAPAFINVFSDDLCDKINKQLKFILVSVSRIQNHDWVWLNT